MSSTIFSNKTFNGINVDDMVDDNRDFVHSLFDKYFARLVYQRDDVSDEPNPAIAAFHEDDAFFAIYAKILPGPFDLYWDGWFTTAAFVSELDSFTIEFKEFLKKY